VLRSVRQRVDVLFVLRELNRFERLSGTIETEDEQLETNESIAQEKGEQCPHVVISLDYLET
jgi:hypothetical protein